MDDTIPPCTLVEERERVTGGKENRNVMKVFHQSRQEAFHYGSEQHDFQTSNRHQTDIKQTSQFTHISNMIFRHQISHFFTSSGVSG